ncbi:N-formylglutamate amidohydrolase [Candidatus Gracilibacteria bacterium]|nr:N-formylglutamate amidohydrolase [Candidatus Gracilibacteria bacterium]MCF7819387.1 N-formylglutamate amidohydrolase [Candidatus Gracilibacteria bacterium]
MEKNPVLVSIPHSSLFVPEKVRDNLILNEYDLRNWSDLYTDRIFDVSNAYVIIGGVNRLVLNLNRAPTGLEDQFSHGVATMIAPDGKRIFKTMMPLHLVRHLIEKYHNPFHEEIEETIKAQNISFFIDGHSMASSRPQNMYGNAEPRADICIGNRDFTTCTPEQTSYIEEFFASKGYSVAINNPYSGKYNVSYHCHQDTVPGIQLELNRALFLNEKNLEAYEEKIQKLNQEIEELVEAITRELI